MVQGYVGGVLVEELRPVCSEVVSCEPVAEIIPYGSVVSYGVVGGGEKVFGLFVGDIFFLGIEFGEAFKPDMVCVVAGYDGSVKIK